MYVPFEELPPHARVWIYQADRPFTDEEIEELQPQLQAFVSQWSAHGSALHASAVVLHRQFIVLATDERAEQPSGCSIDASVNFIRGVEKQLDVNLLDRSKLAFYRNNGVQVYELHDAKRRVSEGSISPEDLLFDNLVPTKQALNSLWLKPVADTWLSKYF